MGLFKDAITEQYREYPDHVFLTVVSEKNDVHYTVRELLHRVCDYCFMYREKGVKQDDTILIILKESLDLYAAFFAGIIHGALPAYYAYPSPKQSTQHFLDSVANLSKYNEIRLVVSFDNIIDVLEERHTHADTESFAGYVDYMRVSACGNVDPASLPDSEHEAFLQFSSGTTGAKKGVKISSGALLNQIEAYSRCVNYDDRCLIASWLPHYHDMGLIACMLMPFVKRIPVAMMSPFEWVKKPHILLDVITRLKATHTWQPNFALGHLTRSIPIEELSRYDLSSLHQIVLCSEPVLFETVDRFCEKFSVCGLKQNVLYNCYAMAENTFAMTSTSGEALTVLTIDQDIFQQQHRAVVTSEGKKITSAGKPLHNIEIIIRDEQGTRLPEEHVGEVTLKSDCMLDCYHNNPEETAKAFIDGFFKTGDLGFIHGDELYITGRIKDLIIVGGENIYPQDIELILNDESYLVPGRNVVFGVEDTRVGTEKVVIIAEIKDGVDAPDTTSLRARILNALNIAVSDIILLPHMTLRKGTAGKISRYLNKQEYLKGTFSAPISAEKSSDLREIILKVSTLSVKPHLSSDTPLFGSGMIDSFGFVDLVTSLEKLYEIRIPEELWKVEFFQTISAIEQTIAALRNNETVGMLSASNEVTANKRRESLKRLSSERTVIPGEAPLWETVINRFPFKGSFWFRLLFRLAGIQLGRNVTFLGRVRVKLRGVSENICIGNNVTLGDGVDIRNRENGRIIIHDDVALDDCVRIVAARDGCVTIGSGTKIGPNTIMNSGGVIDIGRFVLVAGNVNINSSEHRSARDFYIQDQGFDQGTVEIGDDVWLGNGVTVLNNVELGEGTIVAANSVVSGKVIEYSVIGGNPARLLRFR